MPKPKTRNFTYEVTDFDQLEYNQANMNGIFNGDAENPVPMNPDYKEDVMAKMAAGNISDVFRDAIAFNFHRLMEKNGKKNLTDGDKKTIKWIEMKIKRYEAMQDSIKFVRSAKCKI
jgi:hypothetical protein